MCYQSGRRTYSNVILTFFCLNFLARRANGEITHIRIQRTNDGFDLGERQECFSTLYDMIEHYRQNVGELREKNNEIIELTAPILAQMPTLEK
jgi:hypothetical protein